MFYRQAPERWINRAPQLTAPGNHTRSRMVQRPAKVAPNLETITEWTVYGLRVPIPYHGGYDALHGRMMQVPQADLYDTSANPFPANGVADEPNAQPAMIPRVDLKPTGSVSSARQMPFGSPGPVMIFHTPPAFGIQTTPIPAVGIGPSG